MRSLRNTPAFSLIEICLVILISGVLASIAIPRVIGSSCSAADATLAADLAVVRKALFLYAAEHAGAFPGPDANGVANQLLLHSSASGATSSTRGGTFVLGPYLRAIPRCPIGPNKGDARIHIDAANSPPRVRTTGGKGWVYNPNTGEFYANVVGINQGGVTLAAES